MSEDGDGKKSKLGLILLILHLIAVIGIISYAHSGYIADRPAILDNYKSTTKLDPAPQDEPKVQTFQCPSGYSTKSVNGACDCRSNINEVELTFKNSQCTEFDLEEKCTQINDENMKSYEGYALCVSETDETKYFFAVKPDLSTGSAVCTTEYNLCQDQSNSVNSFCLHQNDKCPMEVQNSDEVKTFLSVVRQLFEVQNLDACSDYKKIYDEGPQSHQLKTGGITIAMVIIGVLAGIQLLLTLAAHPLVKLATLGRIAIEFVICLILYIVTIKATSNASSAQDSAESGEKCLSNHNNLMQTFASYYDEQVRNNRTFTGLFSSFIIMDAIMIVLVVLKLGKR